MFSHKKIAVDFRELMKKFFKFKEQAEEEIPAINPLGSKFNSPFEKKSETSAAPANMSKMFSEQKENTLSSESSNSESPTESKANDVSSQFSAFGMGFKSVGLQKKKTQILMKHKQIKTKPNFRVKGQNALLCTDVIFALISTSLNSISEIVYNFTRETKQLYFLSENLHINERRDMAKRAFLAKENAISLYHEIIDKRRFLQKYK